MIPTNAKSLRSVHCAPYPLLSSVSICYQDILVWVQNRGIICAKIDVEFLDIDNQACLHGWTSITRTLLQVTDQSNPPLPVDLTSID